MEQDLSTPGSALHHLTTLIPPKPPSDLIPLLLRTTFPTSTTQALPFPRDGLLFLHQDSLYEPGTPNPLILHYRDPHISPYYPHHSSLIDLVLQTPAPPCWNLLALDGHLRIDDPSMLEHLAREGWQEGTKLAVKVALDEEGEEGLLVVKKGLIVKENRSRVLPDHVSKVKVKWMQAQGRYVTREDIERAIKK